MTIDQLHRKAKSAITAGEARFREAADYLSEARQLGATQRQSAKAIGKSPAWINQLLKWHDGGCKDTPFGPQSKARTMRRVFRQPERQPSIPTEPQQIAKWEATKARAEAVTRMFGAPISNSVRAQLIAALATLASTHPAERARARLGMTWEQLIVAAAAESKAA